MVDEALTDDIQNESDPMTTTKPEKKKRAKKAKRAKSWGAGRQRRGAKLKDIQPKSKRNAKPELNEVGLPIRSPFIHQMGIRLTDEERGQLIERGRKEGHTSFSNIIRAALGFDTVR